MPDRPLSVLHLFAGMGGAALGYQRAGFVSAGAFDVDPLACQAFEYLTGERATCADLGTMTPDEMRAACSGRPDVVALSPPCLPADGPVVTRAGVRAISTVRIGDEVLTHLGNWKPVTAVGHHEYRGEMIGLRLNGTVDVQWFTAEHPIWRRRAVRRGPRGKAKRSLAPTPEFACAAALRVGDRVGFPIDREESGCAARFVEALGDPRAVTRAHPSGRYAAASGRTVALTADSPDLWFLLGVYLGDGYRRASRHEVMFCVGPEAGGLAKRVIHSLTRLGLKYTIDRNGGAGNVKVRTVGVHLCRIAGAFGDGAAAKHLPNALFSLEIALARALVDGYLAADGSEEPRRQARNMLQARFKAASISLPLLRGLQRLLLRFGQFGSIHQCWNGGPQVIEGRTVQTRPRWELGVRLDPKKRTVFEFTATHVWVRVRSIARRDAVEDVWNLSVADDDTFCAPLMATHNCKSFSGCLPAAVAATDKYVDLSSLSLRGIWLALEAWAELPPPLFCLENVPRITTRGRHWLDQVTGLLHAYGYAVAETVHDCGELGGLAQRRRRFLMVARHMRQVPAFLRLPPMRSLRGVGEVLGLLPVPLPGSAAGGPMHRLPNMSPMNWLRLALIPAGGDWRDLPESVAINAGPDRHRGGFGVGAWDDPSKTVVGAADPRHKPVSVADPRIAGSEHRHNGKYGVEEWSAPAHAVIAEARTGKGWAGVADPRVTCSPRAGVYGVTDWQEPGDTVLASAGHDNGRASVADPRVTCERREGSTGVTGWRDPSTAVIANGRHFNGPWQVADPRVTHDTRRGSHGVVGWAEASHCIRAHHEVRQAPGAVADPRLPEVDGPPIDIDSRRPCHLVIMAASGTWHRPMTTLELAALQGFPTEWTSRRRTRCCDCWLGGGHL